MNALCWNCRGTSSKGFSKLMSDIMHEFHVLLCFLLETYASVSNTEKIIKRMRFDSHYIVGSKGQAGGFGIFGILQWKIRVVEVDDKFVHLEVRRRSESPWFITTFYRSPTPYARHGLWGF